MTAAARVAPMPEAAPEAAITLIVPTLDSFHLLPRLVTSLQSQTWPHWQVLFIDGPSGYEHQAWLERLCRRDSRFSWQYQDPASPGIFGAMNQGFAAAPPDHWLLFWGSDDWAPRANVLEQAIAATAPIVPGAPSPDLVVCTGRYARADSDHQIHLGRRTAFGGAGSYQLGLFLGSTPPHQATMIGPGARRRLNHYAQRFQLSADLDYFLRLAASQDLKVRSLDLELVHMGEAGASSQQAGRRLKEVRLAYLRAFGWRWWIPFALRYCRRLWSRLQPGGGKAAFRSR
jgi:glycosyltransferase involved in cell wall biosynthesis